MQDEDAVVESWLRAMDLRDRGAAGHAQRATLMTLRLARELNIDDEHLVHIRQGALLHDIGKIVIPDAILLKPDKLTEQEWQVMRQHPTFGYELLSPIEFLRPTLDIVYCHHEHWDGTGYPRGLKGEEIPLSARLFSVVNVWDSLMTDQFYRRGWQKNAVIVYIREQAGKQFDPYIVKTFLAITGE